MGFLRDFLQGFPRKRKTEEKKGVEKEAEASELTDNDLVTWLDEKAIEEERLANHAMRQVEEHEAEAKHWRQLIKRINAIEKSKQGEKVE